MTFSDQAAWYVIHSKPKCEHLAASVMLSLPGVETYCPRLRFQRVTRRGRVWFVEALFPGYFFARFVPALSLRAVRHSQNVVRVVEFGGQMTPVPEAVIAGIRQEMQGAEVRELRMEIEPGDEVEVTEGPMRGIRGIVNCVRDGARRVRLLMDILGGENMVEVDTAKVLPARAPREALGGGLTSGAHSKSSG